MTPPHPSSSFPFPSAGWPSNVTPLNTGWTTAVTNDGELDYNPNSFYTRATNKKGFGERLSFRIPPNIYAMIQAIVHDDFFPDYGMPADFIRDAIVHHLHTRNNQLGDRELSEKWRAVVRRISYMEATERMKEEVRHWETIATKFHEVMTDLYRDEAWAQMYAYIELSEDLADPCPDPYRGNMMRAAKEWRERIPVEDDRS